MFTNLIALLLFVTGWIGGDTAMGNTITTYEQTNYACSNAVVNDDSVTLVCPGGSIEVMVDELVDRKSNRPMLRVGDVEITNIMLVGDELRVWYRQDGGADSTAVAVIDITSGAVINY